MNITMNFGEAVEALKKGKKVKRSIWGGYWFIPRNDVRFYENDGSLEFMNTTIIAVLKDSGEYAPAQAYQADILAEDWTVIE